MTPKRPMGDTYEPLPVDTESVQLPAALVPLIEQLAAHNHDLWARARIDQGWRWGAATEPDRQLHCNLVPYDALSDQEQELDRQVVRGLLEAVLAMGFEIRREG
jgi:hypothetical protein